MLRTKGVENYVFLKNLLHRPDQGRRAIERLVALTSHIWFRRVIIGCLNFDRKPFRCVYRSRDICKEQDGTCKNFAVFL